MNQLPLINKTVLITGAARRIGQHLAISAAQAGADVILHHSSSPEHADQTANLITALGRQAWVVQADFSHPQQISSFFESCWQIHPIDFLVNNASIFEPLTWVDTTPDNWQRHMDINLTAPFFLSQSLARLLNGSPGRIINLLDWRSLRPGADHFPYTISKAGLAALTKSLAAALSPSIQVNGLALGAVLPPSDGTPHVTIPSQVPAARWASLDEISQAMLFLLSGPSYITGEIIHIDGGRHLT